jgi:hypothetical protein
MENVLYSYAMSPAWDTSTRCTVVLNTLFRRFGATKSGLSVSFVKGLDDAPVQITASLVPRIPIGDRSPIEFSVSLPNLVGRGRRLAMDKANRDGKRGN